MYISHGNVYNGDMAPGHPVHAEACNILAQHRGLGGEALKMMPRRTPANGACFPGSMHDGFLGKCDGTFEDKYVQDHFKRTKTRELLCDYAGKLFAEGAAMLLDAPVEGVAGSGAHSDAENVCYPLFNGNDVDVQRYLKSMRAPFAYMDLEFAWVAARLVKRPLKVIQIYADNAGTCFESSNVVLCSQYSIVTRDDIAMHGLPAMQALLQSERTAALKNDSGVDVLLYFAHRYDKFNKTHVDRSKSSHYIFTQPVKKIAVDPYRFYYRDVSGARLSVDQVLDKRLVQLRNPVTTLVPCIFTRNHLCIP